MRLWRLPGQLLLALINATAILVIVAAILALVTIARINHFAENVAATMTEAVLSKLDLPSKGVLANLRDLTAEVRTLGTPSGNQGRRKSIPSTRNGATEGGADRPECQRRPARKREIDPHRRSDWAIGPEGCRHADEAEGLLCQCWPNTASPPPRKQDGRSPGALRKP